MSEQTKEDNDKSDTASKEKSTSMETESSKDTDGQNGTAAKETTETKDVKTDDTAMKEESTDKTKEKEETEKEETDKSEETPKEGETKEYPKELLQKVAERLKFFFSDVNLRSDRFMKSTMDRHKNMMPLDIMGRFKTIQQHTTDPDVLKESVKVHCSDFLKINDEGIGRIEPYDFSKGAGSEVPLTLFVSNLPVSKSGMFYDCTVKEVIDLFSEYGKVALVRLRYMKDYKQREKKNAIGNAFVEFATMEAFEKAKKDLIEGDRTLVLKGKDLKVKAMADWLNQDKKDDKGDEEDEKMNDKEDVTTFEKGGVISLKAVPDDCSREAILEAIQGYNYIWKIESEEEKERQKTLSPLAKRNVHIDYSRLQPDGAIRFTNACILDHKDKIKELAEKLKLGEIKINNKSVGDAFILEGEEEEEYWKKVMEFHKRRSHQKRNKNNRHGRFNKRQRR